LEVEVAKYNVYGIFHGSKFLGTFEADTPQEAEEMAGESEANHVSLCYYCANELELGDWSAFEFTVEEVNEIGG
jgi:hypothetical protein